MFSAVSILASAIWWLGLALSMIDSLLCVRGCAGWELLVLFGSMLSERGHDVVDAKIRVVEVKQSAPSVNYRLTQTPHIHSQ